GCATILPRHPSRLLAFFETSGFIEAQHRVWIAHVLDQIGAQRIADGGHIPSGPPQQRLETVGRRVTVDFRQLPAVFAFHRTEQAPDIRPGVTTGFTPRKMRHEPSFHLSEPKSPFPYRLQRQVAWRWALLLPHLHDAMPPQRVWKHDTTRSTTVVLDGEVMLVKFFHARDCLPYDKTRGTLHARPGARGLQVFRY